MSAQTAATWLFVPGDRPERFDKAAAAGADEIILDLEDAVAPPHRFAARANVTQWLNAGNAAWVRVGTDSDVDAVARCTGLAGIVVPKAEDPEYLRSVAARLPAGAGLIALVETAVGLHRIDDIAQVVDRIAFGAIDFALDIDAEEADDVLLPVRSRLVLASRLAGIAAPIDGVSVETRDTVVVSAAARRARRLGFGGKLCIHPAQIRPAADAFAPTEDEEQWAARVLAAASAADGVGALMVDGMMIDRPVLARAVRISTRSRSLT